MKTLIQKRMAAGRKAHESRKKMDAARAARQAEAAKCSTTNPEEPRQ